VVIETYFFYPDRRAPLIRTSGAQKKHRLVSTAFR
jgi:hypothetical protein